MRCIIEDRSVGVETRGSKASSRRATSHLSIDNFLSSSPSRKGLRTKAMVSIASELMPDIPSTVAVACIYKLGDASFVGVVDSLKHEKYAQYLRRFVCI